jgi:phosphogluconate dehydratase
VPAAIHLSPEAAASGAIARLRDGDIIRLDAESGTLEAKLEPRELLSREPVIAGVSSNDSGFGRELFAGMRRSVTSAEQGATSFGGSSTLRVPVAAGSTVEP